MMMLSMLQPLWKMLKARALLASLIVCLVSFALILFIYTASTNALTVTSSRDCDANAVIMCGAVSTQELVNKFNNQVGVRTIFQNFGISQSDMAIISTNAVAGSVTSSGKVFVNGREVAINAMTAGRQNMPGSQAVTTNGVTFFKRPPSVSFASSPLSAFVVMSGNQFRFAILASCGNPVIATPVAITPKPKPAKIKPISPTVTIVKPPVVQQKTVVVSQPVAVAASPPPSPVVVSTPTPTVVPVPVQVPVIQPTAQVLPKQIPNTGAGDVVGFGSFITLTSYAAHLMFKRKFSS